MWKSCNCSPNAPFVTAVLLIAGLLVGSSHASPYVKLKDARFPTQYETPAGSYHLKGAGLLKWGIWLDLYAAAYFVDQTNPSNRRLTIHYFVPIKAQQIKTAAEKHLLKQQGKAKFTAIKPALDRLHAAMIDVEKGDIYTITLQHQRELILEHNEVEVLRLLEPELGELYLDLWLGKDPLNEKLRLSLLGISNDR